jgi:hypothetical protein
VSYKFVYNVYKCLDSVKNNSKINKFRIIEKKVRIVKNDVVVNNINII